MKNTAFRILSNPGKFFLLLVLLSSTFVVYRVAAFASFSKDDRLELQDTRLELEDPAFEAAGLTYYVSTSGNDANQGTQSESWRTIQFGVDNLAPGDTLIVESGTYSEEVALSLSGTETNLITIRSAIAGQAVINASGQDYGLHIYDSNYVVVQGLAIEGAQEADVFMTGTVTHTTLSQCDIRNSQVGVLVGCSGSCADRQYGGDNLLLENTVHDNDQEGLYFHDGQFTLRGNEVYANRRSGIAMASTEDDWLIEDNFIHDNGSEGLRTSDFGMVLDTLSYVQGHIIRRNEISNNHGAGIYLGHNHVKFYENDVHHNARNSVRDGHGIYMSGVEYCEVYDNKFHHNQNDNYSSGIRLGGDHNIVRNNEIYENDMGMYVVDGNADHLHSARYNIVRNNLIYKNVITGIELNGAQHNEFYNNTLYGGEGWGLALVDGNYNTSEDNVYKNNIVYYTGLPEGWELIRIGEGNDAGYVEDYNILYPDRSYFANIGGNLYSFAQYRSASGQGIHSINQDPFFVDAANDNFHLAPDSPAIDAGVDVGLPFSGSAPDMGTYEYGMAYETEDINQDGSVDIIDLQLCVNVFLSMETNPTFVQRADVNLDGEVTTADIEQILGVVLK
jgi:parallel beta-helix repeat protein